MPFWLYSGMTDSLQILWLPTYIGWVTGLLGGILWLVNAYSMEIGSILLNLTDEHWEQLSGRMVMGAFSGAVVDALFSPLVFATPPQQAAIGLIAGFSGAAVALLSERLRRGIEVKAKNAARPTEADVQSDQ